MESVYNPSIGGSVQWEPPEWIDQAAIAQVRAIVEAQPAHYLDPPLTGEHFESVYAFRLRMSVFALSQGFAVVSTNVNSRYVVLKCVHHQKKNQNNRNLDNQVLEDDDGNVLSQRKKNTSVDLDGCGWQVTASLMTNGSWKAKVTRNEHNHKPHPRPLSLGKNKELSQLYSNAVAQATSHRETGITQTESNRILWQGGLLTMRPAVASREVEGQAPTSLLSNATIFARLNELDNWRQEAELDAQAWESELEKQKQEDAMILEQRAKTKEEFDQRKAYRRQRGIQTRNEMDILLDALKTNLTRDLSDQSLSNSIVIDKRRDTESIIQYGGTLLESARPVGSSFRPVNETPPEYRLSSGQPQKRKQHDTVNSISLPRQRRKYTRRIPVSGGRNPTTQGSSPAYHPRASAPEGIRGEREGRYWCERRDEYNHGIWTHPVTGVEYFLECPKCQKRKFKSLMGFKMHYTIEHKRKGITVDNLQLALDMYGVPVEPALQASRMQREAEVPQSKDQDSIPYLQQERTTIGEIDGDMYSSDAEPAENDDEDSITVVPSITCKG